MNNAFKGAFFSGLVIPGLGQMVLKRYKRGVVLMVVVISSMAAVVVLAVRLALVILEKISSEGGTIDIQTVSDAAVKASTGSDSRIVNFLIIWILVCWIAGTIDAYIIGRKLDRKERLRLEGNGP